MPFKFCTFLICVSFLSCEFSPVEKKVNETPNLFPSDYLFAQRSFPSGNIDKSAFRSAVDYRNKAIHNQKSLFNNSWTSIGPTNFSGRITDLEMPNDNPDIIYAGSASGGIFKSLDRGKNWNSIFDEAASLSIGDIAIFQKDPNIIYVGTGESNAGGGSLTYDGLGVYKTTNAGASWESVGLENVGSIGKVVVDPNDSRICYVAAMGELFKNNPERGVYKTKDSGDTWEQVLSLSDSTGAIDLAIHPVDGNIIYAAMWERIRRPHNRSYGGITSGIYKSNDGGISWTELTVGLPSTSASKGRIGLAIAESQPNILYALYANQDGTLNGIYKSEDSGVSWSKKSSENIRAVSFMWWFGKIFVNPTDPNDVYCTSIDMFRSVDGADNWEWIFQEAHVDHHAMAIHPSGAVVINGNDGGVLLGIDDDLVFSEPLTGFSNFQFYTCEIDPQNPDVIYGGAQDNGTNVYLGFDKNWDKLFGGDGFRVLVNPNNSQHIYLEYQYGNILGSLDGGQNFYNATDGLSGFFNWNTPFVFDPENPSTLYTGSQRLFKSEDDGQNWESISEILVNTNNPTGNLTFGSITTIDVSIQDTDVIYVGTDDGNIWVSQDKGQSFENISDGIPQRWITAIAHDPWLPSGVYVTVSGFRFGESESHVFYSDNYGKDWIPIAASLPDVPVNDIVIDDLLDRVVYVASDVGVFMTENNGRDWNLLGTDLPVVPIIDIDFDSQSRRLAAASFGRGMYYYDLPLMVSTQNIVSKDITLYPNPANDLLNVKIDQEIEELILYDTHGRSVKTNQNSSTMNIADLEVGQYFIKVKTNNHSIVKGFFKM